MKIFKTKKYSILSNILKYSFVIVFGVMLIAPMVFADPTGGGGGPTGGGGTNITTKIVNPLGQNGPQTIPDFIKLVINIVLVVGIPIVALAIIYTGFLFVGAQGNPEKITKAKKALLYTLIGGALLLGAFVIAQAIGATVEDIKSTT
jgi:hypothetical protein